MVIFYNKGIIDIKYYENEFEVPSKYRKFKSYDFNKTKIIKYKTEDIKDSLEILGL